MERLVRCRVRKSCCIFFLVVIFYLLHSGQGEELTSSLFLVSSYNNWLLFVSVSAWAAQNWLWSRIAISLWNVRGDRISEGGGPEWTSTVIPLGFTASTLLMSLEPLIKAENAGAVSLIGVASVAIFAGIVAWFFLGEDNSEDSRDRGARPAWHRVAVSTVASLLSLDKDEESSIIPLWPAIICSITWTIAGLCLGIVFTLELANVLGTLGAVYYAASILIPIAGLASVRARRTRIPILTILALSPFVLPAIYGRLLYTREAALTVCCILIIYGVVRIFTGKRPAGIMAICISGSLGYLAVMETSAKLGVPHEVRSISNSDKWPLVCGDSGKSSCTREFSVELSRWLSQASPRSDKDTKYAVFVAAAGGGLRAGYWTASVLARLYDCIPNFNHKLVAISGVSGGSLGAGLYAALARDEQLNKSSRLTGDCPERPINVMDAQSPKRFMQSKLDDFFKGDFLAPAITSLFFKDLPQALIPLQIIPDRAAMLEQAFEEAWRSACEERTQGPSCQNSEQLKQSFFSLRDSPEWNPLLFLNGTHEETGKRTITSHVRIDQQLFFDAFDFFDLNRKDIALSTAILNSARFPLVSPAGAITRMAGSGSLELTGHIIDGGFFENNGATTLQEVVDATMRYLNERDKLTQWRPLVIEVVNDAGIQEMDLARRSNEIFGRPLDRPLPVDVNPGQQAQIANQLLSTAFGLYATRTARGILASKMLADFVVQKSAGEFVQFRLCPHMRPSPPLGWLLTEQSRNSMDQLILGHGRAEYQSRYADFLSPTELAAYKACFDDVQQGIMTVRQLLHRK